MVRLIFGAGVFGKRTIANLHIKNVQIDGFVVTNTDDNPTEVFGLPVHDIHDFIAVKDETEIYIGVSERRRKEVIDELHDFGFENLIIPSLLPIERWEFPDAEYERFLKSWYFMVTGDVLDWNNLQTYNEKMQWLKIYDRIEEKTLLSDKYLVREYVKETIGDKYLIPLLGVWDRFDDIDFKSLPEQFVLKCNHGSGWNKIIKDKSLIDREELKAIFDEWMDTNYADKYGLELQYENIPPKIIAEKYLAMPNGEEIKDYKLFVFHGKTHLIQVDIDRYKNHRRNLYTVDWELVPAAICIPTAPEVMIQKPEYLEEMIRIAELLAKDFIHVRVDLYIWNDSVYFGELTFTHGSGTEKFMPESLGMKMGSWMQLDSGKSL